MHVFKFSLEDAQLIKRGIKKNKTHKPAIEYAHLKQLKVRDVCSLSSPLLILRNVWGHIVFFFCRRRHVGKRFQAPKHVKASTMCGLFSILWKTDQAKVSSSNFRETLLPTASFVCCQLDM